VEGDGGVVQQVLDVPKAPRGEVVEQGYPIPPADKLVGQVRSDEPSPPGDDVNRSSTSRVRDRGMLTGRLPRHKQAGHSDR
jgi:hypothetical protein